MQQGLNFINNFTQKKKKLNQRTIFLIESYWWKVSIQIKASLPHKCIPNLKKFIYKKLYT